MRQGLKLIRFIFYWLSILSVGARAGYLLRVRCECGIEGGGRWCSLSSVISSSYSTCE